MPYLANSTYQAPFWLRNSYINTIYPAVFRKISDIKYDRERIFTPDNDFLDLDWSKVGGRNLVVILHGLEGSSDSQYTKGTARYFNKRGWDALALNYRGCSGENNLQVRNYHMGATDDVDFILKYVLKNYNYDTLALVGFSLGGNLTLKYLGEQGRNISPKIKCGVAFSVPIDILTANKEINSRKNWIYLKRFMDSLNEKALEKMERIPNFPKIQNFKATTFDEFDEFITAPIHGFKSALDYWTKCSSLAYIPNIKTPSLLVNAKDDSFLSKECYPIDLAKNHSFFHFEMPKYGGHCGFYERDKEGAVWFEKRAYEFILSCLP